MGIGAHDVLMSGMARASPVVPQGHTSIEVRLASVAGGLIPGDKVTLSSATMTDAEMQSGTPNVADMPNGTETPSGMANDMPDGGVDAQLRTICTEALLTGKPAKDAQGNTMRCSPCRPMRRPSCCGFRNTVRSSPPSING